MSNTPSPLPEPTTKSKFKWSRLLPLAAFIPLVIGAAYMCMFFSSSNSQASTSQSTMRASMSSHGVNVDEATAERVRRACVQSGAVTVDVIAEFHGSKQVVTVQCGDNGDISDATIRTFAPTVAK